MSIAAAVVQVGLADQADEESYLEGLRTCFPSWGDAAYFSWCFKRTAAGLLPDVLQLVVADGRPVAGTSLIYRRLALHGTTEIGAAILSGAWTLPAFRGAGAFTRLIEAARMRAAGRGIVLVVSFVTAGNSSRRRMEAAGSVLSSSWYCRSDRVSGVRDDALREVTMEAALGLHHQPVDEGATRFVYSQEEWRSQFLTRPTDVRIVQRPDAWTAVIERVAGFDRLLTLFADRGGRLGAIDALTARARESGRQLFVFCCRAEEAAALRDRGFVVTDGFITSMPAEPGAAVWTEPLVWSVENGDRM
jgi:hypothetical protein